ncbi:response regulator [Cohnella cellulosilytica]|uniref:Response regulator n=1 Tax=Cohnella cellulosilytica TaxID=986710 RepID=A0ABW2FHT2_9BACL
MYKLLIIDDEDLIVQGLVYLFENRPDLELEIYYAYSAMEALEWLKRTKIDIVLSDIRMPGMSGIALQQEIVRLWPHTIVIFLTGHDDFNYIQTASRNQSFDYILKTEEDEVIVSAVRRAVDRLDGRFERERLLERAREQIKLALPSLRKEWLMERITGEAAETGSELELRLKELDIPLNAAAPILIMLGRQDDREPDGRTADQTLKNFGLQTIVNEVLSPTLNLFSCMYEPGRWIWLIQPNAKCLLPENEDFECSWKHAALLVRESLAKIQEECRRQIGLSVSLIAGASPVAWADCEHAYSLLKRILYIDYGQRKEVLLSESHLSPNERLEHDKDITHWLKMNKIQTLQTYLETSQRERFFSLFYELARHIEESGLDLMKLQWFYSVAPIFFRFMNPSFEENNALRIDVDMLTQLNRHSSWEDAVDYIARLAEAVFDAQKTDIGERELEIVARINTYIEDNLAGDLSLTRIGEEVGFNPSYLSRLYKQLTGEGLHDSITRMRLNKAVELLTQPSTKIHEISSALGFESPAYFTKFFKRVTNLTPSEYREKELSIKD